MCPMFLYIYIAMYKHKYTGRFRLAWGCSQGKSCYFTIIPRILMQLSYDIPAQALNFPKMLMPCSILQLIFGVPTWWTWSQAFRILKLPGSPDESFLGQGTVVLFLPSASHVNMKSRTAEAESRRLIHDGLICASPICFDCFCILIGKPSANAEAESKTSLSQKGRLIGRYLFLWHTRSMQLSSESLFAFHLRNPMRRLSAGWLIHCLTHSAHGPDEPV